MTARQGCRGIVVQLKKALVQQHILGFAAGNIQDKNASIHIQRLCCFGEQGVLAGFYTHINGGGFSHGEHSLCISNGYTV
jgi:agmatine/peptidylarginine deiminase